MKKRLLLLFLILTLLIPGMTVSASDEPVIYKDTITVTADGGRYQIGFVNVEFKKDFIDPAMLPATFEVQVYAENYAENGAGYIEFSPDTPEFFKKVHIRIDAYDGLLYDKAKGENIQVSFKKQQIKAEHFSRHRW